MLVGRSGEKLVEKLGYPFRGNGAVCWQGFAEIIFQGDFRAGLFQRIPASELDGKFQAMLRSSTETGCEKCLVPLDLISLVSVDI